MTLKIRPAHAGELATLTQILHRSKASWGYDAERMDGFRAAFRLGPRDLTRGPLLVAERNGTPLGLAGGEIRDGVFELDHLFIAPEALRQGIGRLLLHRMEDLARSAGTDRLRLKSDHYAEGFYRKEGYVLTGDTPSPMSPTGSIPILEKPLAPAAVPLSEICLTLDRHTPWVFEAENRDAVAAHWQHEQRANPHLWNGRTLKVRGLSIRDGVLSGVCQECSFAAYLAWRAWGYPSLEDHNVFGSAVVRSADGDLLFGVMADHTANPGRIYPFGGSLEPEDADPATGAVDLIGSTWRELQEEAGLGPEDLRETARFALPFGPLIAVALVLQSSQPTATLASRIMTHSDGSEERELKAVQPLRGPQDLAIPGLTPWGRDIARAVFSAGPST